MRTLSRQLLVLALAPPCLLTLSACGGSPGTEPSSGPSVPIIAPTPPIPTAQLTDLSIDPQFSVLASGEQFPFVAIGRYSDGHNEDLTSQVTWSVDDTSVAAVSNAQDSTHGLVTAMTPSGASAATHVNAVMGTTRTATLLTVNRTNRPLQLPVDPLGFPVKILDFVGSESAYYTGSEYRTAASQMFAGYFKPYNAAMSEADKAAIIKRVVFTCNEDLKDPTTAGATLQFPFDLDPTHPGALLWHRYRCKFNIKYPDTTNAAVDYTSPEYAINQLDIDYGTYSVETATALQNYNLGSDQAPDFHYLGRYVQPLDKMLRRNDNSVPLEYLAGVNGGYDYRIDAWSSSTSDNICPPRSAPNSSLDRVGFYHHPAPAQCTPDDNALPSCAKNRQLPYVDDLGDSLLLLPAETRQKSWRQEPFQSFNCGGLGESYDRGVVAFYSDDIQMTRTSPNKGDLAELLFKGKKPLSAIGCGPLLLRDGRLVYDEAESEEGMPIDNYEISGTVGIGYERTSNNRLAVHIAQVNGDGNTAGFHNWMLAPYFQSPYAHSNGANTLGNGGDATFWVHPQGEAVRAVLNNPANPNNRFFTALFVNNANPGVTSNCNFGATANCRARPVHDGVFVRRKR